MKIIEISDSFDIFFAVSMSSIPFINFVDEVIVMFNSFAFFVIAVNGSDI